MADDFTYQLIVKHEGWKTKVYKDTRGNPTIGVGFNLNAPGAAAALAYVGSDISAVLAGAATLSDAQVAILYDRALINASASAHISVPLFGRLPLKIQAVVVDVIYNLGQKGFLEFKKFIAALGQQDFTSAAAALKDSLWYEQVGVRGEEDYNLVLSCVLKQPNPTAA